MNPSENTLSQLQAVILEIYKEVKKIIDRHQLRSFAIGGTCIGAVRHKGFIPWDDDLDIAMPEPDYHRFYELAQKELPDWLEVFERRDRPHDYTDAMRVHDKRTTFIQRHEENYPDEYKGIFIDIMPLCGVPDEPKEQRRYCREFCRCFRMNEKRKCPIGFLQSPKSKLLWLAALPLKLVLPRDYWMKRLDRLKAKYPYDEMKMTGDTWVAHIDGVLFSKDVYESAAELPFEDDTVPCPIKYDEYLTKVFGDYMTLPPENERGSAQNAGIVLIDAKKPYSFYQKQYREHGKLKKETL